MDLLRTIAALFTSLALGACTHTARLAIDSQHAERHLYGAPPGPTVDDPEHVRFAAVGDMGLTSITQAAVAAGVVRACDGKCNFAIFLGDNLYDVGVSDAEDERDLACLLDQYPSVPKYLTLGNHDYDKLRPKLGRAANQLEWIRTEKAVDAHGGYHFYRFSAGLVDAVAIDTNFLVRGRIDPNYATLARFLGTMRPRHRGWSIAFGHHPYYSNGQHGDAGAFRDGGLSLWPGTFFRDFMNRHVLDRVDLYLAGHDHNLQFFPSLGGSETAQVLSGSGAKCSGPDPGSVGRSTLEHYGHGFALVDATPERLVVSFHGVDGEPIWGTYRTRAEPRWRALGGMSPTNIDRDDHCREERLELVNRTDVRELRACL